MTSLTPFIRSPFSTLFDDDDWFFAPVRAGSRQQQQGQRQLAAYTPKLDMIETKDNKLVVSCELPGLTKDNVSIDLHNNMLSISGKVEQSKEHTEEGTNVKYTERSFGSFHREVPVPPGLKASEIQAKLENGILRVELPKNVEKPEAQKITVS